MGWCLLTDKENTNAGKGEREGHLAAREVVEGLLLCARLQMICVAAIELEGLGARVTCEEVTHNERFHYLLRNNEQGVDF